MATMNTARYAFMGESRHAVLCRDCSTRTRGVTIPADEVDAHDAWHAERAVVRRAPVGSTCSVATVRHPATVEVQVGLMVWAYCATHRPDVQTYRGKSYPIEAPASL